MSALGALSQFMEIVVALLLAPLLTGWVNQWRARLQNKSAPGLLQPYRVLHKLFNKESVLAEHASTLFRMAPYIVFGCMVLACAIVPTLVDRPAPVARSRRHRPGGPVRAGTGFHFAGSDGRGNGVWHAGRPS